MTDEHESGNGPSLLALLHPGVGLPIAIVALLVSIPAMYRRHRIVSVPEIDHPFDVEAFLDFEVPDERNAYIEYRQASKHYVTFSEWPALFRDHDPMTQEWAKSTPEHERWLNANAKALTLWKKGTRKPDALRQHPRDAEFPSDRPVPYLHSLVTAALMRASRLQQKGRHRDAWEWLSAAYRCTRHMARNADGSQRVRAMYSHRTVCDGIICWSRHPEVTAVLLRRALGEVVAEYRRTQPLSRTLKYDYVVFDRFFGRKDTLAHLQRFLEQHNWTLRYDVRSLKYFGEPEVSRRLYRHATANQLVAIDRPRDRTAPQQGPTLLFDLNDRDRPAGVLNWHEIRALLAQSRLSRYFLPRTNSVYNIVTRERALHRCLCVALACRAFERRHARLPADLTEVRSSLPTIPRDPLCPKGGTIQYRRDAFDAVVWSVGNNGRDDGGEIEKYDDLGILLPASTNRTAHATNLPATSGVSSQSGSAP